MLHHISAFRITNEAESVKKRKKALPNTQHYCNIAATCMLNKANSGTHVFDNVRNSNI